MTHASAIGSTFDGRIVSETTVGGRPAIVPAIRGKRLDHRDLPARRRPDRPVPRGLRPGGHVGGRLNVSACVLYSTRAMGDPLYDRLGTTYTATRREDPELAGQIHTALGEAAPC